MWQAPGRQASPGLSRPSANSVHPGRAERGQTRLRRRMTHHLDSPTLRLGRCGAARRCRETWPRRPRLNWAGSARSAELHWVVAAQPARLCFPAPLTDNPSPHQKSREWGEAGPGGLRTHPLLVQKRQVKETAEEAPGCGKALLEQPESAQHGDLCPRAEQS